LQHVSVAANEEKKEEGRRKKEEGRRKKEEGRRNIGETKIWVNIHPTSHTSVETTNKK
jgi:hypothetical protein